MIASQAKKHDIKQKAKQAGNSLHRSQLHQRLEQIIPDIAQKELGDLKLIFDTCKELLQEDDLEPSVEQFCVAAAAVHNIN